MVISLIINLLDVIVFYDFGISWNGRDNHVSECDFNF